MLSSRLSHTVACWHTASTARHALTSGPLSKIFRFVENRVMTEVEAVSVLLRGRVCGEWDEETEEATLTWLLEYVSECMCV